MIVYIVCGRVFDESICEYINPIVGIFKDEDAAKLSAAQHETTDQMNGFLSNFYWVEPWEVK
jgi:hypothetical protein